MWIGTEAIGSVRNAVEQGVRLFADVVTEGKFLISSEGLNLVENRGVIGRVAVQFFEDVQDQAVFQFGILRTQ